MEAAVALGDQNEGNVAYALGGRYRDEVDVADASLIWALGHLDGVYELAAKYFPDRQFIVLASDHHKFFIGGYSRQLTRVCSSSYYRLVSRSISVPQIWRLQKKQDLTVTSCGYDVKLEPVDKMNLTYS